jgi:stage II sporulation protein D
MRALLLFLAVLLLTPLAAADDDLTVRVRLMDRERPSSVSVRAETGPADVLVDDRLLLTLTAGSSASFELSGGRVTARAFSSIESGSVVTVRPHQGAHLLLTAGRAGRPYRGALELFEDQRSLSIVNVVQLEDYISSVLPAEYPFPEIEGVKAQAILVRTYALKQAGRFGRHDVVDHVGSQVYRGMESETPLARQAARTTSGEVLTYGGNLIEAVYFSSSGGHTADNESIWDGSPLPYLRGRPDPFDGNSPLHRWQESVDRDRLLRGLTRHYGMNVSGISVARTSPEGRVTAVRIHGPRERVEQANRFRLTVNDLMGRQVLKSTFFTLERRGNNYHFTGRGFGHGVGMSQYGAREKAVQGYSYRDILSFYYSGVTLERRAPDTITPEPMIADAPPPARIEPRPAAPVQTSASRERARRSGW